MSTQTIISCHLSLARTSVNSRILYYQVYDYITIHITVTWTITIFIMMYMAKKQLRINHTLTGLTVGQTYYITFRFKSSGTSYIYRSFVYGLPTAYLIEHVEGSQNSGYGHTENIGDSESSGNTGG